MPTAGEYAADVAASVRDDPAGQVGLMRSRHDVERRRRAVHPPYRCSAREFIEWQLRRPPQPDG